MPKAKSSSVSKQTVLFDGVDISEITVWASQKLGEAEIVIKAPDGTVLQNGRAAGGPQPYTVKIIGPITVIEVNDD